MIDLDALRKVVERATGWGWEAAYRQDVTALVAEVERLQSYAADCESYAADCEQHATFATSKATALERAAVVAWLRAGVHHHRGFGFHLIGDELEAYADHIERGEHCREEGA